MTLRSGADGSESTLDPFPSRTVLDGNRGGSVVRFEAGEDQGAALEGFTLRNGLVSFGAGVYRVTSSPLLRQGTIAGHQAYERNTGSDRDSYSYGAGVFCANSSALLQDN